MQALDTTSAGKAAVVAVGGRHRRPHTVTAIYDTELRFLTLDDLAAISRDYPSLLEELHMIRDRRAAYAREQVTTLGY